MDNTMLEMVWLNRSSDIYKHLIKVISDQSGHIYYEFLKSDMKKRWDSKTNQFLLVVKVKHTITQSRTDFIYDFAEFVQDMDNTMAIEKIE